MNSNSHYPISGVRESCHHTCESQGPWWSGFHRIFLSRFDGNSFSIYESRTVDMSQVFIEENNLLTAEEVFWLPGLYEPIIQNI
jgi:hypothetical protein